MDESQSAGISELVGNCPLAGWTCSVRDQPPSVERLICSLESCIQHNLKLLSGISISGMVLNSGSTLLCSALDYVIKWVH